MKFSSGSLILLIFTWKLRMILQNVCRRVVGHVLLNIFTSNIFPTLLLPSIIIIIIIIIIIDI